MVACYYSLAMEQPPARERLPALSVPPPDLVGSDFEGRYRVEGRLGEGGVGVVYRATDLKLSRPVALKVLHERAHATRETRKRFEREARALAALSHPHVVGIIDFGVADATTYLVMELLEGSTLSELLRNRGHLEPERAFRILRQILLGLASVHRQGLVHRDLKPGNVFLQPLADGSEHVKLLDFGLAKFLGPDAAENGAPITRFGEIFGTPGYLAPEQLSGAPIDVRADIYAVGVVLFEMLAGRKPYIGEAHELFRHQLVDPLPSIQDVCPTRRAVPALENMLQRALARVPGGRYQNIDELSAAFEALPSPAVIELDGVSSDGLPIAEAPTVFDANSEAKTRWHERASLPPPRSLPDPVRRIAERIWNWPGTKALREIPARSRHPIVAAAAMVVGFLSVVVLVALTARSLIETPEADERRVAARSGPSMKAGAADTPQLSRSSAAGKPAAGTERSPGALLSSDGEAESGRASGLGKPTGGDGTGNSESTEQGNRVPAVNPWAGAIPKNLGKVRRSVLDGQKMGKRTEEFLRQYNRARPEDPRGHLLLAALFLNRNWVSDAITHYELAYRIDPGCRGDPDMLRNLLQIAAEKNIGSRASDLIGNIYGSEALPALDRAIEKYARDGRAVKRLRLLRASLLD